SLENAASSRESDVPLVADRFDIPELAERVNSRNLDAAHLLGDAGLEMDLLVAAHLPPNHPAQENERRHGGPRLGTASRRIRHREATGRSVESRKGLREPEVG